MKKNALLYLDGNDYFVIKLIGELRFVFAPTLENALKQLREQMIAKDVIIDITDVDYADSTILGMMTGFFIREEEQGLTINKAPTIICNDKDMRKVLNNIGFDKYFNFKESDPRVEVRLNKFKVINDEVVNSEDLNIYVKNAHQVLHDLSAAKSEHELVVKSFKK